MRLDAPPGGAQLSKDAFRERFLAEWKRSDHRFLKVERRQEYSEPDDPSYQAFERGDFAEAYDLVAKRLREQESFYKPARDKGLELIRLRIVEFPLTDYLKCYELPSYRVSSELGEDIRITAIESVKSLLTALEVPDFLLFDSRCVLVNTYDPNGSPNGALLVTDGATIRHYVEAATELQNASVDLHSFLSEQHIPTYAT
jgi:hypothetical protein